LYDDKDSIIEKEIGSITKYTPITKEDEPLFDKQVLIKIVNDRIERVNQPLCDITSVVANGLYFVDFNKF
jgi:hypothetical protein